MISGNTSVTEAKSTLGAWFPVYAARHKGVGVPEWAFFIAKYFGSGVIIATAFIHVSTSEDFSFGFKTYFLPLANEDRLFGYLCFLIVTIEIYTDQ